ncbi:MAG: hypothetical protein JSW10_09170 [Pseudomonadota bacterium]|nr:MAG: hypothetical protein JSW10_09170 [Pseudomonadota bacterium]
MLARSLVENLAIAAIAAGIMLALAMLASPIALLAGLVLVVAGVAALYVRYNEIGSHPDPLS